MSNMMDYLIWRGDLRLDQVFLCPVDALILSALSYLHLDGMIPEDPGEAPTIHEISQIFLELPEEAQESRIRDPRDRELLKRMGESARFGSWRLTAAEEIWDERKEIQFSALTVLPGDGAAFAVFRGTDSTLVGWKEDFNLGFMDTIPGQWAARDYLEKIAARYPKELYTGGHSKGGNLAVFAAAKCSPEVQSRIRAVYNNDGPGFSRAVMEDAGYQSLLGRIETFVPQSSVVGMLLEHEEPYTVILSNQAGLLQHDPYSWEVEGADFIRLERITEGSRMLDQTVKDWLSGLSLEEKRTFVDGIYELLQATDAEHIGELVQPKSIYRILQKFGREDNRTRIMILEVMAQLVKAAASQIREHTEDETHALLSKKLE